MVITHRLLCLLRWMVTITRRWLTHHHSVICSWDSHQMDIIIMAASVQRISSKLLQVSIQGRRFALESRIFGTPLAEREFLSQNLVNRHRKPTATSINGSCSIGYWVCDWLKFQLTSFGDVHHIYRETLVMRRNTRSLVYNRRLIAAVGVLYIENYKQSTAVLWVTDSNSIERNLIDNCRIHWQFKGFNHKNKC